METLQKIMIVIAGGLTVPIVSWIKSKLPTDFPIQQVVMVSILNLGVVYALSYFTGIQVTFEQALGLAAIGQVGAQYGHGIKKTVEENILK